MPYFTKDESAMTEKTIWLFAGCLIATVGFAYVGNKIFKKIKYGFIVDFYDRRCYNSSRACFLGKYQNGKKMD